MFTPKTLVKDEVSDIIADIMKTTNLKHAVSEAYNKKLGIESIRELPKNLVAEYNAEVERRLQVAMNRGLTEDQNEDGRGRHKVVYTHPDKKKVGNDRFESKVEASKFANDLRKKGYHDVHITESSINEVSKFGQAFRDARKRGDKEFEFGGKRYHTRQKDETSAQHERNRQNTVSANRYAGLAKSGVNTTPPASSSKTVQAPPSGVSASDKARGKTPTAPGPQKQPTATSASDLARGKTPTPKADPVARAITKASTSASDKARGKTPTPDNGTKYNNPVYNRQKNDMGPAHPSRGGTSVNKSDGPSNPNPKVGKLGTRTRPSDPAKSTSISDRVRRASLPPTQKTSTAIISKAAQTRQAQGDAVKGIMSDRGKPGSQTILGIKPKSAPTPVKTTTVPNSQVSQKKIPGSAPIRPSGGFSK